MANRWMRVVEAERDSDEPQYEMAQYHCFVGGCKWTTEAWVVPFPVSVSHRVDALDHLAGHIDAQQIENAEQS